MLGLLVGVASFIDGLLSASTEVMDHIFLLIPSPMVVDVEDSGK